MKNKKTKWKGFFIESYSYINPRGFIEHVKFLYKLPGASYSFFTLYK